MYLPNCHLSLLTGRTQFIVATVPIHLILSFVLSGMMMIYAPLLQEPIQNCLPLFTFVHVIVTKDTAVLQTRYICAILMKMMTFSLWMTPTLILTLSLFVLKREEIK